MKTAKLADLIGKTMLAVTRDGDEINFESTDWKRWKLHHRQDCCESVKIEDLNGDLDYLVGVPILLADESTNQNGPKPSEYCESFTWTFYRFGTIKGFVDIRFLGKSNGYYGEGVSFSEIT